jgi:hypothetical protein
MLFRERSDNMHSHPIHVFIDRKKFDLDSPDQTGLALKQLAGIPLGDVLFLDQPGDDLVINNEGTITLKNGSHLHSQPAADYGDEQRYREAVELPQPDGWTFVIYRDFRIPSEFQPDRVDMLVKLPPTFPDAAPDMFWVSPHVTVGSGGTSPRGTSSETVLGASWQRFSWHLASGTWRSGVSTLRDFLRCIIGRFERRD